jgi:NTE family protein
MPQGTRRIRGAFRFMESGMIPLRTSPAIVVNLALQGGGAHGAFTWGVLDRLLEDGRIGVEGISGTSAGAMNAVAYAHGLLAGGRDGARASLDRFWTSVAGALPVSVSSADGRTFAFGPVFRQFLGWADRLSPEQLNPFDLNPLRAIVSEQIDFERLRTQTRLKLFVATTNANSGQLRLFSHRELTPQVILASACLPTVYRAVEIDGVPYWDGGYAANPAVFPLLYECDSRDILLVLLSPLKYESTPQSARDIRERLMEFTFTSTFLREMRMIAHLRDYVGRARFPLGRFERRVARTHFHVIDAQDPLGELTAESKLAANLMFFMRLKERGRDQAGEWLARHAGKVGRASSVELGDLFY